MKRSFFVASIAWTLVGMVAASAQGLPPGGSVPEYGSRWSTAQQASKNETVGAADMRQANAGPVDAAGTVRRDADQPVPRYMARSGGQ